MISQLNYSPKFDYLQTTILCIWLWLTKSDQILKEIDAVKYLGVTVHPKLSWNEENLSSIQLLPRTKAVEQFARHTSHSPKS